MRDDQESRCYVDHLVAEHRRLHMLVRQMRAAIAQSVGPDERPSFDEVRRVLTRLRDELKHHFAQEDDGGCLDEAVSRCPRLAGEAQRIEAEHPQLLAEISRLLDEAQSLPPTHQNQIAVQRSFGQFCEELRAHERAENALLACGFGMNVNGDESASPLMMDA
jgi:hemerythrin HHE cation binding domain-containing protein